MASGRIFRRKEPMSERRWYLRRTRMGALRALQGRGKFLSDILALVCPAIFFSVLRLRRRPAPCQRIVIPPHARKEAPRFEHFLLVLGIVNK